VDFDSLRIEGRATEQLACAFVHARPGSGVVAALGPAWALSPRRYPSTTRHLVKSQRKLPHSSLS
jgi:hypothetical protein